jgi:hypothetical protein
MQARLRAVWPPPLGEAWRVVVTIALAALAAAWSVVADSPVHADLDARCLQLAADCATAVGAAAWDDADRAASSPDCHACRSGLAQ